MSCDRVVPLRAAFSCLLCAVCSSVRESVCCVFSRAEGGVMRVAVAKVPHSHLAHSSKALAMETLKAKSSVLQVTARAHTQHNAHTNAFGLVRDSSGT